MAAMQQALIFGGAAADPYWNNVSLLLHFEDTGGGNTLLVDSSQYAANRSTTIPTTSYLQNTTYKFGTSSMRIDDLNWGAMTWTGTPYTRTSNLPFTIEYWQYFVSTSINSTAAPFIWRLRDSFGQTMIQLAKYGNGNLMNVRRPFLSDTFFSIVFNQWNHIAWTVNSSNNFNIWLNGTSVASDTFSAGSTGVGSFDLGISSTSYACQLYIDELRITNGVARYTSNFTPPTAPFPNY